MRVIIFQLQRLNNSVNGNPRYKVHTDQGSFNTASDHGFVYMINNGWTADHDLTGREADITISGRGTITDLKYVDGNN